MYKVFILVGFCFNIAFFQSIDSSKIYVDEIDKSSVIAKEKAIKSALKKALISVVQSDIDEKLFQSTLKNIHYSFVTLKESFSDTRYRAILKFTFNKDELELIFKKQPTLDNTKVKQKIEYETIIKKEKTPTSVITIMVDVNNLILLSKQLEDIFPTYKVLSFTDDSLLVSIDEPVEVIKQKFVLNQINNELFVKQQN